ncbi:hypothetical protein SADUNF_Sadunf14G0021800 [Salix dunnii]|uniref:Uncharacterized protein n=1 Tax=Salix dunnii TaxID=1413687 RepID=A0A835JH70_9ROSI|nr:hypothetical protein SADUNF_Sadunf14G0021800 [Salix dunnii]
MRPVAFLRRSFLLDQLTVPEDRGSYLSDGNSVLVPYKQGQAKRHFSMYIFLPDVEDGLPTLVVKVGSESGFLDCRIEMGNCRIKPI